MNKTKKIKIISLIFIFAFCFLLHFLYEWLPNPLFSAISPVNESIWEHMKLIFSSYILFSGIEYYILKKKEIVFNNYLFQMFIVPIIGIIIYLIIYLPLYNIFGENMFISISLLFIIIILEEIISYYLLNYKGIKFGKVIGICGIIIIYITFIYLTYNPIRNYIFYDIKDNKYGIDIYTN